MNQDEILKDLANLYGQEIASRLVLAMLIHSYRTGQPFDVINREIGKFHQRFEAGLNNPFPAQHGFFIRGFRDGIKSCLGMVTCPPN